MEQAITLDEWLRREERSAAWIARELGIHPNTMRAIRNGERTPHARVAAEISAFTSGFRSGPVSVISLLYPGGLPEGAAP